MDSIVAVCAFLTSFMGPIRKAVDKAPATAMPGEDVEEGPEVEEVEEEEEEGGDSGAEDAEEWDSEGDWESDGEESDDCDD